MPSRSVPPWHHTSVEPVPLIASDPSKARVVIRVVGVVRVPAGVAAGNVYPVLVQMRRRLRVQRLFRVLLSIMTAALCAAPGLDAKDCDFVLARVCGGGCCVCSTALALLSSSLVCSFKRASHSHNLFLYSPTCSRRVSISLSALTRRAATNTWCARSASFRACEPSFLSCSSLDAPSAPLACSCLSARQCSSEPASDCSPPRGDYSPSPSPAAPALRSGVASQPLLALTEERVVSRHGHISEAGASRTRGHHG